MSKSRASRGSRSSRRGDRTGSVEVFIRPERSVLIRLVAVLWRLRAELAVTAAAVWLWLWLTARMPSWAALTAVLSTAAVVLVWPWSRRFVLGHAWCMVTRHRLRSCLVQSRLMNHRGYVPWLLWVRPTNVGERAWLLMRPGICVEDVETNTPEIAAACWAREARVRAARRLVALVLVDVVRRDPLTADRLIRSPLARVTGDGVPVGLAPIPVDLGDEQDQANEVGSVREILSEGVEDWELGPDAAGAVLVEPAHTSTQRTVPPARTRPAAARSSSPAPAVTVPPGPARPVARPTGPETVSSSGEDVSDYV